MAFNAPAEVRAKMPEVAVETVRLPLVLVIEDVPPPASANVPDELPKVTVLPPVVAAKKLPVTEIPPLPCNEPDPALTPTKVAAPAPVTLHCASFSAKSVPELEPIVMVPPVAFVPIPIVCARAALPIKIDPLLEVEVPTSMLTFPAVPAEAFPVTMATTPVEVVPVPVDILFAPEAPPDAMPVVVVTPPLVVPVAVSSTKAVLAVVAPERNVRFEPVPVV